MRPPHPSPPADRRVPAQPRRRDRRPQPHRLHRPGVHPWTAGTTYHFLLSVNLLGTQPTYAVDVRPSAGGSYVRLADSSRFRGQQLDLRRLANLATKIDAPAGGTLAVCATPPVATP